MAKTLAFRINCGSNPMALIQAGDVMGLRALNGWQVAGGKQAAPQQHLLIFPIQYDELHAHCLRGLNEPGYVRVARAFGRRQLLPRQPMVLKCGERCIQIPKQAPTRTVIQGGNVILQTAEKLFFAHGDGEHFRGKISVRLQDAPHGFRAKVHGFKVESSGVVTRRVLNSRVMVSALVCQPRYC